MKTKPAKLLMALLFTFASTAFVSLPAQASQCKGKVITACGLQIIKTSCDSTVSSATKSSEADDPAHNSIAKDANHKNDHDYNTVSQKDHPNLSRQSLGNKISICHRMGGAETTLTVSNDGWMSGHSHHDLDTVGRCTDFDAEKIADDSKLDVDKDHKISASDAGFGMRLTTTQIACLKGAHNTNYVIGGQTYHGAELNSTHFTIQIQATKQSPSRGGSRTLH